MDLADSTASTSREYGTIITKLALPRPISSQTFRTLLIIDTTSEYQKALALLVQSLLKSGSHAIGEVVSFDALASEPDFHRTICIFFMELEQPFLKDIQHSTFGTLQTVLTTAKAVLWLSTGGGDLNGLPDVSIIDGLGRVLRLENEKLKFASVKIETQGQTLEHQARSIYMVMDNTDVQTTSQNYEASYIEIDDKFFISRIIDSSPLTESISVKALIQQSRVQPFGAGPPLKLSIGVTGILDTLHFVEDPKPLEPLLPDEVEIKVCAVGVNFKDLLQALGRVNGITFGNECAGTISRAGVCSGFKPGDRVCLSTTAAFNTYTRAKASGIASVPEEIALTEAAAIPTQFGAAYSAIHNIAHMQKGESILIHSGAGGTGQAAIQLAQLLDAEIFVTVGSDQKKQFLIDEYGIPEDHIFSSRNITFAKSLKRLTQNRGVDVVLNTLSGQGFLASWDCIAPYGRFVELGKKEIQSNAGLPMAPFLRNASFTAFEGSVVATERPWLSRSTIEAVLSLFVQRKVHVAKPLHVLSISDTQKAMRMLQSGNTIGKFVLQITDEAMVPVNNPSQPLGTSLIF